MIEIQAEKEKKVKCVLVGELAKGATEEDISLPPKELLSLIKTLGLEECGTLNVHRRDPSPAYGLGKGKTQEIANFAKEAGADCIIFDFDIEPTKQRNWEALTGIPVFDRNEVIIRIFAQRAQTKEAVLQVELARLQYSLPRLSHSYGELSRQRGGAFGNKGSGETQSELDKRQIEDKIISIKKELQQVEESRLIQRKQRERTATATCTLVGYTNAGKSSLLNALTGSDVFVENKLFATLDPTTRKLPLSNASYALLTDTVGFISNLPHTLIKAFRSTLEESVASDLLLIVVDAADKDNVKQYESVQSVLKEIGAQNAPQIIVLNKTDLVQNDSIAMASLKANFPNALYISTANKTGFDVLLETVTDRLLGQQRDFIIPLDKSHLVELTRKNGTIEKEEWLEDGAHLSARIKGEIKIGEHGAEASTRTLSLLLPYLSK